SSLVSSTWGVFISRSLSAAARFAELRVGNRRKRNDTVLVAKDTRLDPEIGRYQFRGTGNFLIRKNICGQGHPDILQLCLDPLAIRYVIHTECGVAAFALAIYAFYPGAERLQFTRDKRFVERW